MLLTYLPIDTFDSGTYETQENGQTQNEIRWWEMIKKSGKVEGDEKSKKMLGMGKIT